MGRDDLNRQLGASLDARFAQRLHGVQEGADATVQLEQHYLVGLDSLQLPKLDNGGIDDFSHELPVPFGKK